MKVFKRDISRIDRSTHHNEEAKTGCHGRFTWYKCMTQKKKEHDTKRTSMCALRRGKTFLFGLFLVAKPQTYLQL